MLFLYLLYIALSIGRAAGFKLTGGYERVYYFYAYLAEEKFVPPADWRIAVNCPGGTRLVNGRQRCTIQEFIHHIWAPAPSREAPDGSPPPRPVPPPPPDQIKLQAKFQAEPLQSEVDKLATAIHAYKWKGEAKEPGLNNDSKTEPGPKPPPVEYHRFTQYADSAKLYVAGLGETKPQDYYDAIGRIGQVIGRAKTAPGAANSELILAAEHTAQTVRERRWADMDDYRIKQGTLQRYLDEITGRSTPISTKPWPIRGSRTTGKGEWPTFDKEATVRAHISSNSNIAKDIDKALQNYYNGLKPNGEARTDSRADTAKQHLQAINAIERSLKSMQCD